MIKPIKKALKNKFVIKNITPVPIECRIEAAHSMNLIEIKTDQYGIERANFLISSENKLTGWCVELSLPELISLTDFIDKLVGNKVICTRHGRGCLRYCNISKMFEKGKEGCYSTVGEKELLADYHRSKLANMTLDEMKVSIRGMV